MNSGCLAFSLLILLGSCSSHMSAWRDDGHQSNIALEELRIELADLKHALNGAKVDLQLLDEKLKNPDSAKNKTAKNDLSLQLVNIERKVGELQRNQEKIFQDLKQLGSHATHSTSALNKQQEKLQEMGQEIAAQNKRLEEVVKIKGTLSSLSQVLKNKSHSESSSETYKIKSGDSLEKIARNHGTTIEAIKRVNDLSTDRIIVGQEIKIPDGS